MEGERISVVPHKNIAYEECLGSIRRCLNSPKCMTNKEDLTSDRVSVAEERRRIAMDLAVRMKPGADFAEVVPVARRVERYLAQDTGMPEAK